MGAFAGAPNGVGGDAGGTAIGGDTGSSAGAVHTTNAGSGDEEEAGAVNDELATGRSAATPATVEDESDDAGRDADTIRVEFRKKHQI